MWLTADWHVREAALCTQRKKQSHLHMWFMYRRNSIDGE